MMRIRRPSSLLLTLWLLSLSLLSAPTSCVRAADAMAPSLPGVGHKGPPFPQTDGADLYSAICQACHMQGGTGAMGAGSYPALASDRRLRAKAYPIARVLNGSKSMPAFKDVLTDAQIAAVVGYVRTHFDNHYADKVSGDDVKALRQ